LQERDGIWIKVDAERTSLGRKLQRETLSFGRVSSRVLGTDPSG
jgi:hypothetical protein